MEDHRRRLGQASAVIAPFDGYGAILDGFYVDRLAEVGGVEKDERIVWRHEYPSTVLAVFYPAVMECERQPMVPECGAEKTLSREGPAKSLDRP
jgi:hypothetical protein